ncbi:MAG: hypothetical protein Q8M02_10335 [Candidatus Didemnitutus sp.]|nr:hypothetical protein [Candidatus Didemnitutus sp.]
MKRHVRHLLCLCVALCGLPALLNAQWKTETYLLKGGWNGIYLHGDATHTTPAELFKNYPTVLEVWRWNPNPDQIQFSATPATPDATSSEWTIWKRDDPAEQLLSAMIGQSSYLIRCSGSSSTTTTVLITQKPRPPVATWLITGANFLGFPVNPSGSTTTFTNYFATFPIATTIPSKIYKYIGGDLGLVNPLQVTAPGTERIDRNSAYWFEAATVGNFTALVEYELPNKDGLAFGRTGSIITVGVMNRSTSALTLTISTQVSEPAPLGQTGISGSVPLTRRVFDSATNAYSETPIVGNFTISVPASGRLDLQFGIDRTQLAGSSSELWASLLRLRDSANFTDVFLPVSAQLATPAGLWVGEISVNEVVSTVAGSPGATTPRAFPLRAIVHVDNGGAARLLSQAFVGRLATTNYPTGICTKEIGLWTETKDAALRIVSSHMPLDRALVGTGAFAVGQTLTHIVTIPFDDPTNPFVHAYHPDHDNRDPRLLPLPAGVESYTITRTCTLTFTAQPPDGTKISGWGTTIYGGTYTETIDGLRRTPLTTRGTFMFRRVSEIAEITLN